MPRRETKVPVEVPVNAERKFCGLCFYFRDTDYKDTLLGIVPIFFLDSAFLFLRVAETYHRKQ